jgi:hypothetical protein
MMTNSRGVNRPFVARPAMFPQDYQKLGLEKGRTEPWEDAAHTDGSPGTHEWWYIDAVYNNVTVSLKLPDGSAIEKKLRGCFAAMGAS